MNRYMAVLAAAAVATTVSAPAMAEFPEKAITVIVPFNPGGGTDTGSRIWARHLEACLGGDQPVIVQNRPGAGGQIGFTEVAKAEPDGYTLISLVQPNVQVGVITNPNAAYEIESFDYLANFYGSRTTLSIPKDSPYNSFTDVLDEHKRTGEPISVGISGIGSDDHQLILKLKKATGAEFKIVPFGDASGIQSALLGGHTPMATLNIVSVSKYPDDLRALVVASEEPVDDLPGVQTFREQGIDVVNGSTHAIGAPAGLPQEARDTLTGCFEQMGNDPEFIKIIKDRAFIMTVLDADETEAFVWKEYETLKSIWESDPWTQ